MSEHVHRHVQVDLPDDMPKQRNVTISCAVTWASTVVAVALAIVTGDWPVLIWASLASILAAGWWIAVRRWQAWRELALALVALLEELATESRGEHPEG